MTKSYFEIGGHIIECDIDDLGNTSVLSSKTKVPASKRPERGRSFDKGQSSLMTQTEKDSLAIHTLKMWSYPARSGYDLLTEKPQTILGFVKDPRTLAAFGIQLGLDQIELNYRYFVKGESSDW